jgi:ureidoglycolate hydrolase
MSAKPVALQERALPARPISAEAFAPFGDFIPQTEDGVPFGAADAKLDLSQGTPRFYVMRLDERPMTFTRITRHIKVTQCLAAVGGKPWLIAVAPPLDNDKPDAEPALESIRAFVVPGDAAIMLHKGTWHAGPFFEGKELGFFNLELADTNVTDHQNSYLDRRFGVALKLTT